MPWLLQLALPINKHMFEGLDPNHRARLDSFLGVWIEIRGVVDP